MTTTEKKVCQQCGRAGVRGFNVAPAQTVVMSWGTADLPEFTECANKNACRKRWPKHSKDYE